VSYSVIETTDFGEFFQMPHGTGDFACTLIDKKTCCTKTEKNL